MQANALTANRAVLVLENGDFFIGQHLGVTGTVFGEVVFNTSLSGYQEILTDPSYKSQLITLTMPEIGNYGIDADVNESDHIHAHGLIIKAYNPYSGPQSKLQSLKTFLAYHKTIAITNIDTRRLTRIIRTEGACRGVISTEPHTHKELLALVESSPDYNKQDLPKQVTTQSPYTYKPSTPVNPKTLPIDTQQQQPPKIVVIDYGVKRNILRILTQLGANVRVIPATADAKTILAEQPDGILLSNGPGDPQYLPHYVAVIKDLINQCPIFGICLGHQLLSLAYEGSAYKLRFGHRGANHPIKTLGESRIAITSQNHGYAIANHHNSFKGLSHINLNDQSVAGLNVPNKMCFSVQYHPEGAPGPHDSYSLFKKFLAQVHAQPQKPTPNNEKPTPNDKKPTPNDKKPTPNDKKPTPKTSTSTRISIQ